MIQRKVIKAKEIMHTKHIELDGLATVQEALTAMEINLTDVVIVKKRDEHDSFGIVLLSDIAKKVLARDRAAKRVNIYEIMSKPVITIEPDLDVRYCARLFERFGISNAPVVQEGKVVGIVSYSELVFKGLTKLFE